VPNKIDVERSLVVFFAAVHPCEGDVCVSEGIVSPRHHHPVTLPYAISGNAEIISHVKGIDNNVLVMDRGKVIPGEAVIFPGLPGIPRYRHKGTDQKVPKIPTPIIEDREELPVPVYLRRREHVIHL
jgi:hypothetical protein